MTTQDLKNNENEIIEKITDLVGEENVKATMATMLGGLDCCDTIDELIETAISINDFERVAKKDSKLVQMLNAAHIGEKYNILTKEFDTI